jgi:hypothetical protein
MIAVVDRDLIALGKLLSEQVDAGFAIQQTGLNQIPTLITSLIVAIQNLNSTGAAITTALQIQGGENLTLLRRIVDLLEGPTTIGLDLSRSATESQTVPSVSGP